MKTKKVVIKVLYKIIVADTSPVPKHTFLKLSIMAVIGFRIKKSLNPSGTSDRGYTIGVAYMNRDRKNSMALARSRYLVVTDEIINPSPVANRISHSKISGSRRSFTDKYAVYPLNKKKTKTITNITN